MLQNQTFYNAYQSNNQHKCLKMTINPIKNDDTSSFQQQKQIQDLEDNKMYYPHSSHKKQRKAQKTHYLTEWTPEDQKKLSQLHNLYGNKWLQISQILKKTDNEVKNHYHSRLRRTLRKLNKYIFELNLNFKPLKKNIISKILHLSQQFLTVKNKSQQSKYQQSYYLKNKMFDFTELAVSEQNIQELTKNMRKFIQQLVEFNKEKRKVPRYPMIKAIEVKGLRIRNRNSEKGKGKTIIKAEEIKQQKYEQIKLKQEHGNQQYQYYNIAEQKQINNNVYQHFNFLLSPPYHHQYPFYYTMPMMAQPTLTEYQRFEVPKLDNNRLFYNTLTQKDQTYFWINQMMF